MTVLNEILINQMFLKEKMHLLVPVETLNWLPYDFVAVFIVEMKVKSDFFEEDHRPYYKKKSHKQAIIK